jgi:serine/threonine protein kinase
MNSPQPLLVQPGQVVLNKYQVLRPLGAGRYGQVFQVRNLNLGLVSALKIVLVSDPDRHKAVVEARAQSLCGHDHVVEVRTADVFDRSVLIEMEFIEGGSLGDRLLRDFVPVADSVAYVKHILYALEHAHARGLVHRDVKPGNIMLASNGAKLSDFGTATHPATGISVIDEFYMPHASPEAANVGSFSAASDVFATGLTLMRAVSNMAAWGHIITEDGSWRNDVANGNIPALVGFPDYVPTPSRRSSILPAPPIALTATSVRRLSVRHWSAFASLVNGSAWDLMSGLASTPASRRPCASSMAGGRGSSTL